MRRPLIAGNWKMNLDAEKARRLVSDLAAQLGDAAKSTDVAVCPPAVYLTEVRAAIGAAPISIGAQDVYYENSGAFTGELAPAMLRDVGCTYVIIGHSERRHTIGHLEDDQMINRKVRAAMAAGLVPILCVGEMLSERQAGQTNEVLTFQTVAGLIGVELPSPGALVIAYEPVWAIGTGQNATPEQAQEAHAHIRGVLRKQFAAAADQIRILYGGSMKAENAETIIAQPDVDGGLVGGASLKADSFLGIIRGAAATARR